LPEAGGSGRNPQKEPLSPVRRKGWEDHAKEGVDSLEQNSVGQSSGPRKVSVTWQRGPKNGKWEKR